METTLPVSAPPVTLSKVAPFRDQVVGLLARGVECRAIFYILREEHAFAAAYGAVYRFVHRLEPRTPEAFVRVETGPAEEAQVDFGYSGLQRPCLASSPLVLRSRSKSSATERRFSEFSVRGYS